jgi:hypothetical protein
MPDRGVEPAAVVAVLDPRSDVADRAGPGGPDATVVNSVFKVAKKLSAMALSQQIPVYPIDRVMPWAAANSVI